MKKLTLAGEKMDSIEFTYLYRLTIAILKEEQ